MYAIRSYYDFPSQIFCDTVYFLKCLIDSRITSYNVCYTKLLRFYLSKRWPSIKRPSIAIFVGDTVRRDSPHINNIRFFGMRHGTVGSDDRDPSAVAFPNDLTQSYANLIFMDGHSGKTNYTNASNTSAPVSSTVLPAESYFLYAGIAN